MICRRITGSGGCVTIDIRRLDIYIHCYFIQLVYLLPLYCSFVQVQHIHKLLLRVKNRSASSSAAVQLSPVSSRHGRGPSGPVLLVLYAKRTAEWQLMRDCLLHILNNSHWACALLGNKDCISFFRQVPTQDDRGTGMLHMLEDTPLSMCCPFQPLSASHVCTV